MVRTQMVSQPMVAGGMLSYARQTTVLKSFSHENLSLLGSLSSSRKKLARVWELSVNSVN